MQWWDSKICLQFHHLREIRQSKVHELGNHGCKYTSTERGGIAWDTSQKHSRILIPVSFGEVWNWNKNFLWLIHLIFCKNQFLISLNSRHGMGAGRSIAPCSVVRSTVRNMTPAVRGYKAQSVLVICVISWMKTFKMNDLFATKIQDVLLSL